MQQFPRTASTITLKRPPPQLTSTLSPVTNNNPLDNSDRYAHIKILVRVRPLLKGEKDSEGVGTQK